MRNVLSCVVAGVLLVAVAGCKPKDSQMDMGHDQSNMDMKSSPTTKPMNMSMTYTCTMHPEVISDKPGKCPKCGMDLVEKK
jgi:hypothetical protein